MFDYIILDAETRMPVPNQEDYLIDCTGHVRLRDYPDAHNRHCPPNNYSFVPCEGCGMNIIQFHINGKTEEVRY